MLIAKSDFGNIEMLGTLLVCGEGRGIETMVRSIAEFFGPRFALFACDPLTN
jgi:hypothetical protein